MVLLTDQRRSTGGLAAPIFCLKKEKKERKGERKRKEKTNKNKQTKQKKREKSEGWPRNQFVISCLIIQHESPLTVVVYFCLFVSFSSLFLSEHRNNHLCLHSPSVIMWFKTLRFSGCPCRHMGTRFWLYDVSLLCSPPLLL